MRNKLDHIQLPIFVLKENKAVNGGKDQEKKQEHLAIQKSHMNRNLF